MMLIPFMSAILYLIGGQWWKPARWLMGIPIALIGYITGHGWISLLAIPAYFIATSAFPYGSSSWLNFLGEWGKFAVCGLVMGLASIVLLGWIVGSIQGIVGAISFLIIKYLDDRSIITNPLTELLRGFMGTICYLF